MRSGGSRGGLPAQAPSMDQNFFNFMGFLRKSIKCFGSAPPSKELLSPRMTNAGSAPGASAFPSRKKFSLISQGFS